jgi:hypothetical protein
MSSAPIDVDISGIQQAQAAAVQALGALKPTGAFGKAVQYVTGQAHRYATQITPVDTGSWRASHRPEVHGLQGRIFLDPTAVNPKSHSLPSVYGPRLETQRGGRYAVYEHTVEDAGPGLLNAAGQIITGALP